MSWSEGCWLLRGVWSVVRRHIPEAERQAALTELMGLFAGGGCDTLLYVVCDDWPESQAAYDLWYCQQANRIRGNPQQVELKSADLGGVNTAGRTTVDPYLPTGQQGQ